MSRSFAARLTSWSFASILTISSMSVVAISPAHAGVEGGPLHGALDVEFSDDGYLTDPDGTSFVDVAMRRDRSVVCGNDGGEGLIRRFKPNGNPDPTFSGDGRVIFDPATLVNLSQCLVLKDGRIVVIGGFADAARRGGGPNTGLVGVFRPDGHLDHGFSGDGWRPLKTPGMSLTSLSGVATHPGGKLVVVGHAQDGSMTGFLAARLNLDGSLDTTFSKDGRWFRDIEPPEEDAVRALVRSDGTIVVLGYTRPVVPNDYLLTVVTLRPNGTLDPDAAGDGVFETDVDPDYGDVIADARLRPDGRVVAAVSTNAVISGEQRSNVTRLTSKGRIDLSFGGGDGYEPFNGAAIGLATGGGTIVALGELPTGEHFVFTRFLSDGTLDASFGTNGVSDPGLALGGQRGGIAMDTQGRIVAAGSARDLMTFVSNGVLMRLLP